MLNYKKSINSSHQYIQDLPTATKTDYYDNSPSKLGLNTPKTKNMERFGHKVHQAKVELDEMINEINQKKNLSINALETVSHHNKNAMGFIGQLQSPKNADQTHPQQHFAQTFMPSNQNPAYTLPYADVSYMKNVDNNQGNKRYHQLTLEEQNIELRRALNDQIRQNNNLLKRINFLETENDQLRNQLMIHSPKMNSPSAKPMNFAPSSNFMPKSPSNFANKPNYQSFSPKQFQNPEETNYTGVQDYEMGTRMQRPKSYAMNNNSLTPRIGKGGHHNKVASELLKELQELKDYDENLRQKTISLLKGQH